MPTSSLRHRIDRGFAFLGMIGSQRKARIIRDHFMVEQIGSAAAVAAVACPVGLDIAARSVPEIAVSILAQYIAQRAAYLERRETGALIQGKPDLPACG